MTFILKLDLDVLKMYLCTDYKVFRSRFSKVIARTDRHTETDRLDCTHYNATFTGCKKRTLNDKVYGVQLAFNNG